MNFIGIAAILQNEEYIEKIMTEVSNTDEYDKIISLLNSASYSEVKSVTDLYLSTINTNTNLKNLMCSLFIGSLNNTANQLSNKSLCRCLFPLVLENDLFAKFYYNHIASSYNKESYLKMMQ